MRITIKTDHGYLSIQPNGTIEFREVAGGWETFNVESLDPLNIQVPPTTPPDSGGMAPQPTSDYVAYVKDKLLKQGKNLSGACGAFEVTKNVAWDLRNYGYGLLDKPSGNMCSGYAVDIVMLPDGRGWDILGDGGGANQPQWNQTEIEDGVARYRPAVTP
jgi:hypothetical protein